MAASVERLDRAARALYEGLPWLERVVCGRLIVRQMLVEPKRERERERYGLKGSLLLCRGRCLQLYGLAFLLAIGALSVAGEQRAALVALVVGLVDVLMGIGFATRPAREGRRWRSAQDAPQG